MLSRFDGEAADHCGGPSWEEKPPRLSQKCGCDIAWAMQVIILLESVCNWRELSEMLDGLTRSIAA